MSSRTQYKGNPVRGTITKNVELALIVLPISSSIEGHEKKSLMSQYLSSSRHGSPSGVIPSGSAPWLHASQHTVGVWSRNLHRTREQGDDECHWGAQQEEHPRAAPGLAHRPHVLHISSHVCNRCHWQCTVSEQGNNPDSLLKSVPMPTSVKCDSTLFYWFMSFTGWAPLSSDCAV